MVSKDQLMKSHRYDAALAAARQMEIRQ